MALHLESLWRQPLQVARAGMHIKHARALCALEVVVVRMPCRFVARHCAGQFDGADGAAFQQQPPHFAQARRLVEHVQRGAVSSQHAPVLLRHALRSLRREALAGDLLTVFAALVLGVAVMTAVGTLVDRVNLALANSTAEMLGGDLGISGRAEAPAELVGEGINPALIENAGKQLGMPTGPLAVLPFTQGRSSIVWTLPDARAAEVLAGMKDRIAVRAGRPMKE